MRKNDITFDEYIDYEVVTGTSNHSFPLHIHQSLCLGMITKGEVFFTCDNRTRVLSKGEKYIIIPKTSHSFTSIAGKMYSHITVCLKNEFLPAAAATDFVNQALSFIDGGDLSILSVEDVCSAIGVSKFHFTRVFKNEVGISPYQYILNQKIKKIRQEIVLKQSLSDLVFEYGFSDQSHLCNTFKKHMGISPLEFALKHNKHY